MIDTSLNKKYTAKEGTQMDFSPIPDGEYKVRIKEITPWEAKTQNVKVIQRDEDGKALLDDKGEKVTELVPNCTFYNANAKLEIVGGAYDGRIIFHNLTTHPNMDFNIPSFLYGFGVSELSASEMQDKTKGLLAMANIYTDSYTKMVQNKETGLDEAKERLINRVRSFKQIPSNAPTNETEVDLGI